MRIFIGLSNIAGYYGPLNEGLTELGHKVSAVYWHKNTFAYGEAVTGAPIARLFTWLGSQRMKVTRRQFLWKLLWRSCQEVLRLPLLLWAAVRHDSFVLAFGNRIFPGDLMLLRLLGKKVVMIYHGSDSRPPFLDGCQFQRYAKLSDTGWARLVKRYHRQVRRAEANVSFVVNLPASGQFLSRPAVSFLAMGIPCRVDRIKPSYMVRSGAVVRVLHCPSNPEAKGTLLVRNVIENLKSCGYKIDYVEVINQPNRVVHEELDKCDLVIDQTFSDTPLAGFATEAAMHGRPVVVAGYCMTETATLHPGIQLPPSCYCHPSRLQEEVERMVADAGLRESLGRAARTFVEEQWNHLTVAGRLVEILEKGPRSEWLFEPGAVTSSGAAGASEEKVAGFVRRIISAGGERALCAEDKPRWKANLLELVRCGALPAQRTLLTLPAGHRASLQAPDSPEHGRGGRG